ncbi:sodium channel protein Nach [Scaptodrosophila lebanonensis]|uniref:Sodium channel protein Nach n=1 Tax=Drosophila lebanonensis TaxID=7225 RepID=A0A6J2TNS2_DROLE|nr:sodium channel protein Nach [Scaptodrosophila lebanonensis]
MVVEEKSDVRRVFKDFLRNSYISGLKPFLMYTPVRFAKALWLALLIIIVVWTHVVIVNLTLHFIDQPTELRMTPTLTHVSNSPFLAVAVCSPNKVSKRLLHDYATKIYQHQSSLLNSSSPFNVAGFVATDVAADVDDMARRLLWLVYFYLNAHDEPDLEESELSHLHWLLTSYYNTSQYSVRDILRILSSDCDELVVRGIVFGAPVDTRKLFLQRATSSSICCLFNYKRPSYSQIPEVRAEQDAEMASKPEVVFESNSILNSVQFVLQGSSPDDFTYTYLSNDAFQVYLFQQEDYATIQSSTLGELLIDHNTIVEIPIQPKFLESSATVRGVSPEKRLCYFPDEGRKLLNSSYYSLEECLMLCRMASMLQHCGCVSSTMSASTDHVPVCSVLDLPCLLKWKRIWYGFKEFSYVQDHEDDDDQNVKQCGHCLPTCNGVEFHITTNVAPLRKAYGNSGYSFGLLKGLKNDRPLAIIKLYFRLRYAQATAMDVASDWVVLLNRFGGILSLMYGFSIITYIEILYYLTGKWFVYYYRAFKKRNTATVNAEPPTNELYWKELSPKGLTSQQQQ